jgi:hypothetical protein
LRKSKLAFKNWIFTSKDRAFKIQSVRFPFFKRLQMRAFLALSLNGFLDEDQAIQDAITASLEEETLRHARPRGVPTLDPDADEIECSYQAVFGMTQTLNERIRGLLELKFDSKLSPGRSIPKLPPDRPIAKSSARQSPNSLRQEQDREYDALLHEVQEAERTRDQLEVIAEVPIELEPEPVHGIQIAVAFSGNERKARRFRASANANQVFWWIAIEKEIQIGSFNLIGPNANLDPEKTLEEQEIANKTLFRFLPN